MYFLYFTGNKNLCLFCIRFVLTGYIEGILCYFEVYCSVREPLPVVSVLYAALGLLYDQAT
jgi:hypothetical protein